jgi:hypothetical protein
VDPLSHRICNPLCVSLARNHIAENRAFWADLGNFETAILGVSAFGHVCGWWRRTIAAPRCTFYLKPIYVDVQLANGQITAAPTQL